MTLVGHIICVIFVCVNRVIILEYISLIIYNRKNSLDEEKIPKNIYLKRLFHVLVNIYKKIFHMINLNFLKIYLTK